LPRLRNYLIQHVPSIKQRKLWKDFSKKLTLAQKNHNLSLLHDSYVEVLSYYAQEPPQGLTDEAIVHMLEAHKCDPAFITQWSLFWSSVKEGLFAGHDTMHDTSSIFKDSPVIKDTLQALLTKEPQ